MVYSLKNQRIGLVLRVAVQDLPKLEVCDGQDDILGRNNVHFNCSPRHMGSHFPDSGGQVTLEAESGEAPLAAK